MSLTIEKEHTYISTQMLERSFRERLSSYISTYPEELYDENGGLQFITEIEAIHDSILMDIIAENNLEQGLFDEIKEDIMKETNWNHKDYLSAMSEVMEYLNDNKAMAEDIYSFNGIHESDFR